MVLNPDFKEFIQLLNEHNVQYLIVGGYAVAFHGHPRFTKDLDIWLWLDRQNAESIIHVLKSFGFSSLALKPEDFLEPNTTIQLGYPPNRIDLLTSADGIRFEDCYPHRIEQEVDGVSISFIDLKNLKKNKKASGRFQDLADLENLT